MVLVNKINLGCSATHLRTTIEPWGLISSDNTLVSSIIMYFTQIWVVRAWAPEE